MPPTPARQQTRGQRQAGAARTRKVGALGRVAALPPAITSVRFNPSPAPLLILPLPLLPEPGWPCSQPLLSQGITAAPPGGAAGAWGARDMHSKRGRFDACALQITLCGPPLSQCPHQKTAPQHICFYFFILSLCEFFFSACFRLKRKISFIPKAAQSHKVLTHCPTRENGQGPEEAKKESSPRKERARERERER